MFLSCTRSIQSTPSQLISLRFIQMLSSHLRLCLPIVLFLSFPHQNPICVFPLTFHMPRSSHDSWLITQIIPDGKKIMDFLMCSLLQSPVTPCLLHKNIFLITLFAKILSLATSQNVKDLFSYPYKTTGRVKQMGRQRTLDRMVEGISGVQSALNFFMNTIVTC